MGRNLKTSLFCLFFLVVLSSCSAKKRIIHTERENTIQTDSVKNEKEEQKDLLDLVQNIVVKDSMKVTGSADIVIYDTERVDPEGVHPIKATAHLVISGESGRIEERETKTHEEKERVQQDSVKIERKVEEHYQEDRKEERKSSRMQNYLSFALLIMVLLLSGGMIYIYKKTK